jgi:hypothetical protein
VKRWLRSPWTLTLWGIGDLLTNTGIGLADVGQGLTSYAIGQLARKGAANEKPRRS